MNDQPNAQGANQGGSTASVPAGHAGQLERREPPKVSRGSVLTLVAVLLIVAVIVAVVGIVSREHASAELKRYTGTVSAPTVSVEQPVLEKTATEIVMPGNMQAYTLAPIYARTTGYVKAWYTDIGAKLKEAETVLIHAGAVALGLAAIQLAKRAGARVLATASDESRLERLKPFGIDFGINYKTDDFVEKVMAITNRRGVDVALDSIAGKNLARSIQSLAYGGRAITVGVAGRDGEGLDPVSLWRNNSSLHGVYFPSALDREHERVHAQVQETLESVALGELTVVIDRVFALEEAEQAHRYVLDRRAFGRVLMHP